MSDMRQERKFKRVKMSEENYYWLKTYFQDANISIDRTLEGIRSELMRYEAKEAIMK